jgi:hypothetical protein
VRSRRSLLSDEDATKDLWPSFTDLISTTALILFVLVLLAYVQSLVSGKQLAAYRLQISASEEKLKLLDDRVRRTAAEVEAGQTRLRLSEAELEKQRDVIAESNRELGDLRARLAGIALLRVEVLERVKRSIESELGARSSANVPMVSIGDTGNIVINESLVFEYNSYAIKPDGKPLLDSLARGLGRLLSDPAARDSIDAIVIRCVQPRAVISASQRGAEPPVPGKLCARGVLRQLFRRGLLLGISTTQPRKERSRLPAEPPDRGLGRAQRRQRAQGHRRIHARGCSAASGSSASLARRESRQKRSTSRETARHGYPPTYSIPSRSSWSQRRRSGFGTASHSLNTLPAGANGFPTPAPISSATRSFESFTTKPDPL